MLVLSRKLGESIEIGDKSVIVRVLGIKRSKVQLGVEAPAEVAIHRSEKAAFYSEANGSDWSSSGSEREEQRLRVAAGTLLEDLVRVQAEIATLAELVPEHEQMVARQVARAASERLSSIERTVRFLHGDSQEKPIGSFIQTHSELIRETPFVSGPSEVTDHNACEWKHQPRRSGSLVRESSSVFSSLPQGPCSLA